MRKLTIILFVIISFFTSNCTDKSKTKNTESIIRCNLTTLSQIQKIADARLMDREDAILDIGYLFTKEYDSDGTTIKSYSKECNNLKHYEEVATPKAEHNNNTIFIYSTLDVSNYLSIKIQVKQLSCSNSYDSSTNEEFFNLCSDGHNYRFFQNKYANATVYGIAIMPNVTKVSSDCDITTLSEIQTITEAKPMDRENIILSVGYLFDAKVDSRGEIMRTYNKNCFESKYYECIYLINYEESPNYVLFSYVTYSKENYLSIRNQAKKLSCNESYDRETGRETFTLCSNGNSYDFNIEEILDDKNVPLTIYTLSIRDWQ